MTWPSRRTSVWLLVGGAAAFSAVAAASLSGSGLFGLDETVSDAAREGISAAHRHAWFEVGLSVPGDDAVTWVAAAIGVAILAVWRQWGRIIFLAGTVVAEKGTVWLLKAWTAIPRPETGSTTSDAFPSGHAAGTLAVYGLLLFLVARGWTTRQGREVPPSVRRSLVAAWFLLSFIVGAARVLAGVHWPSDVLAGWALGTAAVGAALLVDEAWTALRPSAATSRT